MVVMSSENPSSEVIVATGGYDHTVKLWQAKTGVCQRTFQHTNSFYFLFSPLRYVGSGPTVFKVESEPLKQGGFVHMKKSEQVNDLEITPNKQMIAAAGYQQILMYELNSKNPNPVVNYEGVIKNVTSIGFQEDGKWMYTGGEDCSAKIWDLRSRNLQCQRIFQVSAPVNCVKLHPNQSELVVGDQSGVIHLWDLKTDHNEQLIPESEASIQDISIDPEGSYMAAVNNKGHCYIWSLTNGGPEESTKLYPKHKIEAHSKYALSCEFSPDSTLLVTTSADQTARVFKTADFSLHQELKLEGQRWVWSAAFSVDSQYILTASSDGVARLWNVETGTVKRDYNGHQKAITALAFRDEII